MTDKNASKAERVQKPGDPTARRQPAGDGINIGSPNGELGRKGTEKTKTADKAVTLPNIGKKK